MPMVRTHTVAARPEGWALVVHGGAGGRLREFSPEERAGYGDGLRAAYLAGEAVLAAGGDAVDAACAAVVVLEDDRLFNAGHGAMLTTAGTAELDACVMTGDGSVGATSVMRHAKNPILFARHVLEEAPHVLLVDPPAELVGRAGCEVVDNSYFVTPARQAHLANALAAHADAERHGTVGCVAVDVDGFCAVATSTGGTSYMWPGRVGDTPVPGAGSFARDGVVALSGTGDGEAFLEGCLAHDIYARMAYGGAALPEAVAATFADVLDSRDATGGVIAVAPGGSVHLAHNSAMMFAAFREGDEVTTWV